MFPVFPEFYARIEKFFQSDHPGTSMARSVLANRCPGTVFVDHPMNPTTALVAVDNSFLIGGRDLNRTFLERVIHRLRQNRDLHLVWANHRTPEWLPGEYTNTIQRKEFRNRDGSIRPHLPELSDIRVCKVTSELLPRCQWTHEMERIFGGLRRFFLHGLGFCLVRGEDILAEAYAAFWGGGPVEIAVVTDRHHRRRGLGLRVCLELIEACEAMGFETCWNCDARNRASIGLANRLGYRSSTDYTLLEYPAMRIENRRERVIG